MQPSPTPVRCQGGGKRIGRVCGLQCFRSAAGVARESDNGVNGHKQRQHPAYRQRAIASLLADLSCHDY